MRKTHKKSLSLNTQTVRTCFFVGPLDRAGCRRFRRARAGPRPKHGLG
jgi:hypothetical protein